jgi:hypothetical protein
MSKRVDRHGMLGPYGVRYSWVYWAATAAAFAFLIVDLFDDGAIWNIAVVVFVIIGIAVRPYGFRGTRHRLRFRKRTFRQASRSRRVFSVAERSVLVHTSERSIWRRLARSPRTGVLSVACALSCCSWPQRHS